MTPAPKRAVPGLISVNGSILVSVEAVTLENRQRGWGMDVVEPEPRRLRVRCTLDYCSGIDFRAVLLNRDVDVANRVAHFFLEHRFRLPGHARIGHALHQE